MKKVLAVLLSVWVSSIVMSQTRRLAPDIIIVNFKEQSGDISVRFDQEYASVGVPSLDALLKKYRVLRMEKLFPGSSRPDAGSNLLDLTRYYRLQISAPLDLSVAMDEIGKNPFVEHVEPTSYVKIESAPNEVYKQQNPWSIPPLEDIMKDYISLRSRTVFPFVTTLFRSPR